MTSRVSWVVTVLVVAVLLAGGVRAGEVEMRSTDEAEPNKPKKERAELATNPKHQCEYYNGSQFLQCFQTEFDEDGFSVVADPGGDSNPGSPDGIALDADIMEIDQGTGELVELEDLCVQENEPLISGIRLHLEVPDLVVKIRTFDQPPAGGVLEITIDDELVVIPDTTNTGGKSLTEEVVFQLQQAGFGAATKDGFINVIMRNGLDYDFQTVGLWTDDPALTIFEAALVRRVMGLPLSVDCSPKGPSNDL